MKTMPERGDVVRSTAGHDQGRLMIVWETADADCVTVVDGRTRTLEKPKKKKCKHLKAISGLHMEIQSPTLSDADIRKFLKACEPNLA
jgi:ribosomal protein L14E/L6E/L27E